MPHRLTTLTLAVVVVGLENAEILTPNNQSHLLNCTTPKGFTGGWPGTFPSVLHVEASQ